LGGRGGKVRRGKKSLGGGGDGPPKKRESRCGPLVTPSGKMRGGGGGRNSEGLKKKIFKGGAVDLPGRGGCGGGASEKNWKLAVVGRFRGFCFYGGWDFRKAEMGGAVGVKKRVIRQEEKQQGRVLLGNGQEGFGGCSRKTVGRPKRMGRKKQKKKNFGVRGKSGVGGFVKPGGPKGWVGFLETIAQRNVFR